MTYENINNNQVELMGKVTEEPVYSHELYGEKFYESMVEVERLSEKADLIPVTISERLIASNQFKVGDVVGIKGQFRSYNKIENDKSKLMLTVFVRELVEPEILSSSNSIELAGFICKDPIYRTTPFKREICDVLVAVNRAYNKSDYLPCIAWGRNARFVKGMAVGSKVFVSGRIQSREYQKKISEFEVETRTAYEISITHISDNENFIPFAINE